MKKTKYDINVFFEFQSFWEKLVRPEKSQTYLVCSRVNCSVVSTSVLFEETKLNTNTSSLPRTVHPDNIKTRLCLTV